MKNKIYTIISLLLLCGWAQAQIDSVQVDSTACIAPQFTVYTDGTDAFFNWLDSDNNNVVFETDTLIVADTVIVGDADTVVVTDTVIVTNTVVLMETDTFLIIYRLLSGTPEDNVYEMVVGDEYVISGLLPMTEYIAWMAKICNGDTSAISEGELFTTGCGTFVAPYEEHFGSIQHCWTLDPSFTLTTGYIYTTNYASSIGNVDTSRAISPAIDVSTLNHPYLKFSRIQNVFDGTFKNLDLYYRDNEEDEWHYLGTFITPTTAYTWKTDSIAIPSHSTTLQLGFFSISHGNSEYARISLADIYIYDGTDCPPVTDLSLLEISANTAVIHWINSDTTSYQVRYRMLADTTWIYTDGLNGQVHIAPIVPLADYEVQVAPLCNQELWASYTFNSGCVAYVAPFEEHFDSSQHCWTLDPAFNFIVDNIYTTNFMSSSGYFDTVRAITPVIDVSGLSHPYLKFSRIQNEAGGEHKDLALYYREYEEDEWHCLGTFITTTSSSEWKTDSLPIPSHSATLQLGFFSIQHENQQFPRISLDDIYIYDGTDCPPVSDLTLAGFSGDTAFIHWVNNDTVSNQVRYRILPDTNWIYTDDLNGLACISPLAILANYEVQVFPLCNPEQGVSCTFTTGCGTYVAPFEEHFGSNQHCWTLDSAFTNGLSYIYTTNYISPTMSTNHGYVDTSWAISPVIDVSALDNPYLKFSRVQSEYNGARKDLNLYYREYEEDVWHYLGTYITPTTTGEWITDSLAIPSHSTTLQLGFFSIQHGNSQSSRISLDDIYVYDGPDCEVVSDVALSNISGDTAYIHWVGNSPTGYTISYRPAASADWMNTSDLGGYAIIESLTPLTQYEVAVTSNCSPQVWVSCTFTSQMGPIDLPYFTDFSDTADRGWQLNNGTCFNHWKIGTPGTYLLDNALFVTYNDTAAGYGLDNYYTSVVASKSFNMSDISTVNVEFDVICGGNSNKDFLKVFFAPASVEYLPSEVSVPYSNDSAKTYAVNFQEFLSQTGNPNYYYKLNLTQGNVLHVSVEMPNPAPNDEAQLVFVWRNDHSTYNDAQPAAIISNVHVWQPDCDVVTQLNVYDIVGQDATVMWNPPAMAPSFIVECKLQSQDWTDPGVMIYQVDTNFLVMNGLLANSAYDVRVRVDCGNELGMGNWRYTSFNTACAIVVTDNNPYVEDFTTNPECWNLSVNPNHTWQWHSSTQYLYHATHYNAPVGEECPIYSPMMDISAVSHPFLKFSHKQQGDINFHRIDYIRVDYRTSSMNPWQTLRVFDTETTVLKPDSLPLPEGLQYIQFAFVATYQNGTPITLDDVSVYNGPSCMPLTSVTVVDVTANAAAISWEGHGSDSYIVRYRDISDTAWIYGYTTDTTYIISNLQDSHTYVVEVSNNCEEPNWLSTQLSTLLSAANIPYFTDFSPYSDRGWLLNNGNCVNYWTMGEVDAANDVYGLFVTNDGSTPGYNITTTSVVTAEKIFEVGTADSITVEFDVRIGGEERYDFIKLFLAPEYVEYPATSTADYNQPDYAKYNYTYNAFNFTPYFSLTTDQTYSSPYIFTSTVGSGFVHIAAVMRNPVSQYVSGNRAKVVFLWKNDYMDGTQPGAIITNISVRDNACVPVTQLSASNVHSTSADIAWNSGAGGETEWILEYKESSAAAWAQAPVSGTPEYTLTGLTPSTDYEVRVQADCGNGATSVFNTIFFTTTPCDFYCPYTFILYDSHGDGWNGNAAIHVLQQGADIATLVAMNHLLQTTPTYDTVQVDLCHGEDITLQWTWGMWWQENGVTVLDPNGVEIYSVTGMVNHDSTLTTFTTNCPFMAPVVVTDTADNITQTEAVLNGHIADAGDLPILERGFEWKAMFASNYTAVNVLGDSMSYALFGLSPSTDYIYRAFATTMSGTTYGDDIIFTTMEEEIPPCPAPTDLHVTDSSSQTISIAWTENGDAEQWNIQYRSTATGVMSSGVSSSPAYLITDLEPNTEYQIQVKSVCGPVTSDWTPVVIGKTTNTGIADYDRYIKIYPNPANDVVHVECTMDNAQWGGEIQIVDVYGKVVAIVETRLIASLQTRIDVSGLAAGVYFVRIATDRGFVTKPFVKQ